MLSQLTVCALCYITDLQFLPARRCVSADNSSVSIYQSVSVCHKSEFHRTAERIKLVFLHGVFLTSSALCGKDIHIFTKMRVLSSETLSQAPYLENFVTACLLLKRVIDLARERWTLTSVIHWTVVCQLNYNTSELHARSL